MNTLEAVAQILKREGVEWVSCFPSNNLLEEVAKVGIRPVMFRHERGALMAADGFSRMNDRNAFGVAITQGGPGSENSMGGLAQAWADNVPDPLHTWRSQPRRARRTAQLCAGDDVRAGLRPRRGDHDRRLRARGDASRVPRAA